MRLNTWIIMGVLVASTGCGSDADGSSGQGGNDMAQMVSATSGAQLSAEGVVDVAVPAGAVTMDTEISIELVDTDEAPKPELLLSQGVQLKPEGLNFDTPISLSLRFNTSGVPDMSKVKLAWFDEGQNAWMPLADSSVDANAGSVSATTGRTGLFGAVYDD